MTLYNCRATVTLCYIIVYPAYFKEFKINRTHTLKVALYDPAKTTLPHLPVFKIYVTTTESNFIAKSETIHYVITVNKLGDLTII